MKILDHPIPKVVSHINPAKIKDSGVDRAPILWEMKGKSAYAKLGDVRGEVLLSVVSGYDGKDPNVIKNLSYATEKNNISFVLAKPMHYYEGHKLDYAFENANGFLVGIEGSGGGENDLSM